MIFENPDNLALRMRQEHTCSEQCNCSIHGVRRAYSVYYNLHTCVRLGCQDEETQRMNNVMDHIFKNGYREVEEIDWYVNP